jgi:hypothetical protein
MARAHELLAQERWMGADIGTIIQRNRSISTSPRRSVRRARASASIQRPPFRLRLRPTNSAPTHLNTGRYRRQTVRSTSTGRSSASKTNHGLCCAGRNRAARRSSHRRGRALAPC